MDSYTRHGFCVLGNGHRISRIWSQDCIADNLGIGSGEEAANATRDLEVRKAVLGTSHARGAYEVNDGCHDVLLDGLNITGTFSADEAVMGVSDHNRSGEKNTNITIRNVVIYLDSYSKDVTLLGCESGATIDYEEIYLENIVATNVGRFCKAGGEMRGLTFKKVTMYNCRLGLTCHGASSSRKIRDVLLEEVFLYGNPAETDTSFGHRIENTVGLKVRGGFMRELGEAAAYLMGGNDRLSFIGLETLNMNTQLTSGFMISARYNSTNYGPAENGEITVKECSFVDDRAETRMTGAIRIGQDWTNAICKDNRCIGHDPERAGNDFELGSPVANNMILTPNINVPAAAAAA